MRINKLDNVFQVYNKNAGVKNVKSDKASQEKDQIKISERAVEFQFALQKIKDVEEIRMDKVEFIKNQIETGTYEIDGQKIAEKMLESINFDKKI
ncbi:flagellar biosynthesis anti-sigma factor FlgM [Tissierella sp.]|uniref:flagellar biosynthesis anti-sigma factor FlgM n=1 Tax=Tissierella sp. TaxID=41274 RepID=UPI0028541F59|nr:flagellar biosynthesis anti-sigma factor FlgM [Tissierella sp.]MDR7856925.1 flagellar biosynthesis anti-sigma factor FlgM [Tissierella sp.]